jgi:hypothetical protein
MTWNESNKFANDMRRDALDSAISANNRQASVKVNHGYATVKVTVNVSSTGNSFEYRINDVLFNLSQFEQALTLLSF